MNMNLLVKQLSMMQKVFPHTAPQADWQPQEIFANETLSFQLAWYLDEDLAMQDEFMQVQVSGALAGSTSVYAVQLVPCELPCYDGDDCALRREAGLFPDVLQPLEEEKVFLVGRQWRSLWFEVDAAQATGAQTLRVTLTLQDGTCTVQEFAFTVLAQQLPPMPIPITQWMHYDCIAEYYGVQPMSAAHWTLVWPYVAQAVRHGLNMLLVPLVTPPLDTLPGRERPTVQLVDVTCTGGDYTFGFDKLEAFLKNATACGVQYFEMTPLFTQWGAQHAPKVMATVEGKYKRIFGWETASDGAAYTAFLQALLPALSQKLTAWGYKGRCWFHISDEPQKPEHYIYYLKASALIRACLPGWPVMDTVGSMEFYQTKSVDCAIAGSDVYDEIAAAGATGLWAYYCCAQYKNVANHYLACPPWRTRILGAQMYRTGAQGFLHWGYNFWNSKYSARRIQPYAVTDGGAAFPGGDPFVVYPGANGAPVASIRQKLLRQAMYDYRTLLLAEENVGKNALCVLLDAYGVHNFHLPSSGWNAADMRRKVNELAKKPLNQTNKN